MSNFKFTVVAIALVVSVLFTGTIGFARQTAATPNTDAPSIGPSDDSNAPSEIRMAVFGSDAPFETCGDVDYSGDLNESSTYQSSDWDLSFVQLTNNMDSAHWFDINGDGLTDFVYAYQYRGSSNSMNLSTYTSCVALNTGSGFEIVHRCYAYLTKDMNTGDQTQTYRGDCAG